MISVFMFDKNEQEMTGILKNVKDSVAYCSDDSLSIVTATQWEEGQKTIEKRELLDVGFFDVTVQEGLELTRHFRSVYELAELFIIADYQVSPMKYMTPDIRAASLLLRPFTEEQKNQVILQFFRALYRNRNGKKDEKKLIVENRQGKIAIPYSSIYYIEVREKKVFVRLKEKEYSKYESMENMIKELPEDFIRCHRSFVVNKNYISRIKLSENTIYLEDEIMVPLSRSYKAKIKEYMNQLQNKKESQNESGWV